MSGTSTKHRPSEAQTVPNFVVVIYGRQMFKFITQEPARCRGFTSESAAGTWLGFSLACASSQEILFYLGKLSGQRLGVMATLSPCRMFPPEPDGQDTGSKPTAD